MDQRDYRRRRLVEWLVAEIARTTGCRYRIKLEVPELQARYLEVVGRSTGSDNKAYLIWKIREAQKGRIPVGPRKSPHREGVTFKVLPLRMESDLVDKLDEAWKRQGMHSRMDLFRKSLQAFLQNAGEADVAAMLATSDA